MKIGNFFGNGELRFIRTKNFQKTKNFSGWVSPTFTILFDGISEFRVWISPSCPKIQALRALLVTAAPVELPDSWMASTIRKVLRKILQFYLHKISLQHELKLIDYDLCFEISSRIEVDKAWLWTILWSDEAHFFFLMELLTFRILEFGTWTNPCISKNHIPF